MKKLVFVLLLFVSVVANAQKGISYQAVILDPTKIELPGQDIAGQPLVNGNVWVKFAIVSGSSIQFEEVQQTKTDAYGLVNLTIGSVATTAFNAITWDATQKSLQVFVSFDNGATYTKVSDQKLSYSPYALFAETAGKLGSTLGIAGGGTGATTAVGARANLGLGNVDNTSDAAKPISTATQVALDLKANAADLVAQLAVKASLASPTFTGTVSGISKSMVGLDAVDNTSDAAKPISTATQAALNLKANSTDVTTALALKASLASPTFTGTVSGISKSMVGLDAVDNTSDAAKPISTATQAALNLKANSTDVTTALALKASLASPTFTGTVSGIDKTMVGLGSVDNTSDAAKPISTATQAALDLKSNAVDVSTALALKASLASPAFTGTVTGITKTMVGLGNVDNTSDASKPISTATLASLNLKAPLSSPNLTGLPIAPTAAFGTNSTQIATTQFVQSAISANSITIGAINASSNQNGASINSGVLSLSPANASFGGIITSGNQIIGGVKTFNNGIKTILYGASELDQQNTNYNAAAGSTTQWQSFTSGKTGKFTGADWYTSNPIINSGPVLVTLKLYSGEGTSGAFLGSANSYTVAYPNRDWIHFDFSNLNISIEGNSIYTIELSTASLNVGWIWLNSSNSYVGGRGQYDANWDFIFKTYISPSIDNSYSTDIKKVYNDFPWITLSAEYSGSLITTEHGSQPTFPENLPDGFNCTLLNYSNYTFTSNVLSTAKFVKQGVGGNSGVTSFSIPSGGSVHINVVTINGAKRYYIFGDVQ